MSITPEEKSTRHERNSGHHRRRHRVARNNKVAILSSRIATLTEHSKPQERQHGRSWAFENGLRHGASSGTMSKVKMTRVIRT